MATWGCWYLPCPPSPQLLQDVVSAALSRWAPCSAVTVDWASGVRRAGVAQTPPRRGVGDILAPTLGGRPWAGKSVVFVCQGCHDTTWQPGGRKSRRWTYSSGGCSPAPSRRRGGSWPGLSTPPADARPVPAPHTASSAHVSDVPFSSCKDTGPIGLHATLRPHPAPSSKAVGLPIDAVPSPSCQTAHPQWGHFAV